MSRSRPCCWIQGRSCRRRGSRIFGGSRLRSPPRIKFKKIWAVHGVGTASQYTPETNGRGLVTLVDPNIMIAINEFTKQLTVPILYDNPTILDQRGTGTLFTIAQRYFLVTASHLFDGKDLARFVIPSNPIWDPNPYTLGRCTLIKPSEDFVDIAVLELLEPQTLPIRLSPTATSGSVRPCSWTFTGVAIFGSHNRSQTSSDFFPTTGPAPPTWRMLAGATGLFAPLSGGGRAVPLRKSSWRLALPQVPP